MESVENGTHAVHTYSMKSVDKSGSLTEQGALIPILDDAGTSMLMAIHPQGNTLFIAGSRGLIVTPTLQ